MPETAIALHPDVGASFYLSRLPGHLGEYKGLTGARLDGADMMATNLATHFVPSYKLEKLEEQLGGLHVEDINVISKLIDDHSAFAQLRASSPLHRRTLIYSCFGKESMEEIIQALVAGRATGNPWYPGTLNVLRRASPSSLKISLRSVREGRRQQLHECLIREFRLSVYAIEGRFCDDFSEGLRAVLIDKDHTPKWNPLSLEQVKAKVVAYHFCPLGEIRKELQLPIVQREPKRQLKAARL